MGLPIEELEKKAREIRLDVLEMVYRAGSGHIGGSYSSCEITVALFFSKLRHDPKNPRWEDRDRFIMSKGHASPLLYAVLAHCGYIDRAELATFRRLGSRLQGHIERDLDIGVENSAGSLGQGLSMGNGLALAARLRKKDWRVYVLVSDGDIQEGQFWEAAVGSTHRKLDNLCLIVDNNNIQLDGFVDSIKSTIYPIAPKLIACGWEAVEIDGHSFEEVLAALEVPQQVVGKPTAIVARTVKGKGVSIFENNVKFHGVAPNDEEYRIALKELS